MSIKDGPLPKEQDNSWCNLHWIQCPYFDCMSSHLLLRRTQEHQLMELILQLSWHHPADQGQENVQLKVHEFKSDSDHISHLQAVYVYYTEELKIIPTFLCDDAFSIVVKTPEDSTTYSAPKSPQGISAGSLRKNYHSSQSCSRCKSIFSLQVY